MNFFLGTKLMIWKFRLWKIIFEKEKLSKRVHLFFNISFLKQKLKNKMYIARNSLRKFFFIHHLKVIRYSIQRFFKWTHKFYSFQIGLLSSNWDKLLIHNWKGDSEYIKSLKQGETLEAIQLIKQKPQRASIRTSFMGFERKSVSFETDQFVSFKEFTAKAKFSRIRKVSIMKQRLQVKEPQSKFENMIPSIMPYALNISPETKLKNEM